MNIKLNARKIVSLLLKLTVIVFALTGTFMSVKASSDAFMGGGTVLMYFTIQSNIALALVSLVGGGFLLTKKEIPNWWYIVKYIATLSITLTGIVFCAVLAPTMGALAWNAVNVFTHVVVPIAAIIDFFIVSIDADIKKRNAFLTPIPPIIYAIYAGIGYVCNWNFGSGANYPYFFLNWGSPAGAFGFSSELPFMGCVWWIIVLAIFLICIGLLYLCILNLLKKRFNHTKTK